MDPFPGPLEITKTGVAGVAINVAVSSAVGVWIGDVDPGGSAVGVWVGSRTTAGRGVWVADGRGIGVGSEVGVWVGVGVAVGVGTIMTASKATTRAGGVGDGVGVGVAVGDRKGSFGAQDKSAKAVMIAPKRDIPGLKPNLAKRIGCPRCER
jgi:hypothetical protein